ncbi:MAG: diacylglycerol kinase family protein [Candidatus Shapirobacteria bacterium]
MKQWCQKFLQGFYFAGRGVWRGFKERNMKVHAVMAIAVMFLGLIFNLNLTEWSIVLILIALVFSAELLNTSIEELANVVKKKCNCDYEETRATRDLAAGGVLIMAFISAAVGLIIFLPKIF